MFQVDFKNPTTLQTTHYELSTIALSESVENEPKIINKSKYGKSKNKSRMCCTTIHCINRI